MKWQWNYWVENKMMKGKWRWLNVRVSISRFAYPSLPLRFRMWIVVGCAQTAAAGGIVGACLLKDRSQTALNDMQMLLCLYPEIGNGCFGKRIFEWIQDVFGRGCGQGCRKWCLQSCPMEVLGRLKFSILHFQGSGGEEKGGRKGVRGGSERGQHLCVQKVVEQKHVEI